MKVLRPCFSAEPNKKYSRSSEAQVLENGKFENIMNGWFDNTMIYSWIVIFESIAHVEILYLSLVIVIRFFLIMHSHYTMFKANERNFQSKT